MSNELTCPLTGAEEGLWQEKLAALPLEGETAGIFHPGFDVQPVPVPAAIPFQRDFSAEIRLPVVAGKQELHGFIRRGFCEKSQIAVRARGAGLVVDQQRRRNLAGRRIGEFDRQRVVLAEVGGSDFPRNRAAD